MNIYLVRSIETKRFEGVYWANSLGDLWDTFDQFGDPFGYEFAKLSEPGAICVGDKDGVHVPQWQDIVADEDMEDFDFAGFEADENLATAMHNQHELNWRPFCAADEDYGLFARIERNLKANDNDDVSRAA